MATEAIPVVSMTPSQLTELLLKAIPAHHPVLITGMPGCGKSEISNAVINQLQCDLILSHPVVSDPTDYKGLPMASPGDTEARFLPFGDLAKAKRATKLTAWMFDDIGQAQPATQASLMQLILCGELNGVKLPPVISFLAVTNRRTDRAGVSGILEPVKSRFVTIVDLMPNIDDWSNWANNTGWISPMLIAFLRFRPDLLAAFQASADMTNSPTPRTWVNLSKVENLGLSSPVESIAFAGSVGHAASLEYIAFRRMYHSLTLIDAVMANPDKVTLPSKSNELYAVCTGLAHRANEQNFARICKFAERLATEAGRGEFSTMLVKDCTRRNEKIVYTDAYVRSQCGVIGQLMSGSNN